MRSDMEREKRQDGRERVWKEIGGEEEEETQEREKKKLFLYLIESGCPYWAGFS